MDILDQILAEAWANQYTDDQRLGYIKKRTVTHDGNSDGKDILPGEIPMVLASSVPIDTDRETVKRITLYEDGECITLDSFLVLKNETSAGVITQYGIEIAENQIPVVASVSDDVSDDGLIIKKGVYFLSVEGMYVSCLETETIHQIDPKFIPLPYAVVELSTAITDTVYQALTETESAALDAAIASGKPIYLKGQYNIGGGNPVNFDMFPMVVRYPDDDSYVLQYSISQGLSSLFIQIAKSEEAWVCGAIVFDFSSLASTTETTETTET